MESYRYRSRSKWKNYLCQGDVLADVPMVQLPSALLLLRAGEEETNFVAGAHMRVVDPASVPDAFREGLEWVGVTAFMPYVMVLSQTCDIEQRKFTAICPVFPISNIENPDLVRATRQGKVHYYFWLPETNEGQVAEGRTLPESFGDLSRVNSVPRDRLVLAKRVASLSQIGHALLSRQLNIFFTRPVQE